MPASPTEQMLRRLASERILVLDGAMGTMIQALGLDEEGYRGARFDAWNREVRGNNDLLILSQPEKIRDIHLAYFRAGADIVSTNTFSSTCIAQADYGMAGIARELNREGARLARAAADLAQREDGRPRFVAGAIGPTNRTASISPDVSIRASAPSPSTSCAAPMPSRSKDWSKAAPISSWSRPSSTRSTPRPRSRQSPTSSKVAASRCRS